MSTPLAVFQQLRSYLNTTVRERREVIDGCLAALLARQHVFLLGPAGTGKSLLARTAAMAFHVPYFEYLLSKFTVPEELFGPISLTALEQDRYRRVTAGMLPTAVIAFIDEWFKANSAILNNLLSVMNERVFFNDGQATACPLTTLFAASNELPQGKELEANFDRFVLRYHVQYVVQRSSFLSILKRHTPQPAPALPGAALAAAQAEVEKIVLTDETMQRAADVRDACRAEGIEASDRRWHDSMSVVQSTAWLNGAQTTTPEDLLILAHVLWRDPDQRRKVAQIVGRVADPVSSQANEILDAARDTTARVAAIPQEDRRVYRDKAAEALDELKAQLRKLEELAKGAGPRAQATIDEAKKELQTFHGELSRSVAHALGFTTAAPAGTGFVASC